MQFGGALASTAGVESAQDARTGLEGLCRALGAVGFQARLEHLEDGRAEIVTPTCPLRPLVVAQLRRGGGRPCALARSRRGRDRRRPGRGRRLRDTRLPRAMLVVPHRRVARRSRAHLILRTARSVPTSVGHTAPGQWRLRGVLGDEILGDSAATPRFATTSKRSVCRTTSSILAVDVADGDDEVGVMGTDRFVLALSQRQPVWTQSSSAHSQTTTSSSAESGVAASRRSLSSRKKASLRASRSSRTGHRRGESISWGTVAFALPRPILEDGAQRRGRRTRSFVSAILPSPRGRPWTGAHPRLFAEVRRRNRRFVSAPAGTRGREPATRRPRFRRRGRTARCERRRGRRSA